MSERELQHNAVEFLRRTGWVVLVNSKHRRALAQERDKPDVEAFRDNVTLLLEFKSAGGRLRPGQAKFAEQIAHQCGVNLRYAVIESMDGLREIVS